MNTSEELKCGIFTSALFAPTNLGKRLCLNLSRLIGHASKWHSYEKIVDKLKDNLKNETPTNRILDAIRIASDDIVTICHGDCWVNNILFRYQRDSPNDAVFVSIRREIIL